MRRPAGEPAVSVGRGKGRKGPRNGASPEHGPRAECQLDSGRSPMPTQCPSCRAEVKAEHKFCRRCGARLHAAVSVPGTAQPALPPPAGEPLPLPLGPQARVEAAATQVVAPQTARAGAAGSAPSPSTTSTTLETGRSPSETPPNAPASRARRHLELLWRSRLPPSCGWPTACVAQSDLAGQAFPISSVHRERGSLAAAPAGVSTPTPIGSDPNAQSLRTRLAERMHRAEGGSAGDWWPR